MTCINSFMTKLIKSKHGPCEECHEPGTLQVDQYSSGYAYLCLKCLTIENAERLKRKIKNLNDIDSKYKEALIYLNTLTQE